MAPSDIQAVILTQKGEIKQTKLKGTTVESIGTLLKKKEPASLLGRYPWKGKILTLFGYLEGRSETENQHHLPPPLEGITFYGDILVIASQQEDPYTKPISLKTSDYETFYTAKLEGEDSDGESLDDSVQSQEEVAVDTEEVEEDVIDAEEENDVESYKSESEEELEAIPIIKPTRVKKAIVAVVQEEPEISESATYTENPYRKRVVDLLTELVQTKSIDLEACIYKKALENADKNDVRKTWNTIGFRDAYMAVSRKIVGNLNPNSYIGNKGLYDRFMSNEISTEQLVNLNYYELCPDVWKQMLDRQTKKERIQLEGDFSRATDKWVCNGCKMRKCTYYELQTRSADEPMTIFIHCLNCGKRWTQ